MFASDARVPELRVRGARVLELGLLVVGACVTAALVLISDNALLYGFVAVSGILLVAYVLSAVGTGNMQCLILIWVLLYPLGYYYLSFPQEHSVFTLDRAFIALLGLVLVVSWTRPSQPLPKRMLYAALCWAGFIATALVSLRDLSGWVVLYSVRVLIDSFVMPGVLALYIFRKFDVRRHLLGLSVVVSLMSIYLAVIGMAEALLHRDLLPLSPDNALLLGNDEIFRANGPFESGSTFGLVGVINCLLLLFLRRTTASAGPSWQRSLQPIGTFAAFLVSMIPMHRGIVVTWIVVGLIEAWQNRRKSGWWGRTGWRWAALLLCFSLAPLALKTIAPGLYEDRVEDVSNINARLAQHQQSLAVIRDHLWVGAGFGQFNHVVSNDTKYRFFYEGVPSIDYPHNNVLNVAAETGLVGLLFFILAQCFLLQTFGEFSHKRLPGEPSWVAFLSIFAAYGVFGMDVSSGYFEELNIWYMFVLAICLKYAYTEHPAEAKDRMSTRSLRDPIMHAC